MGWLQDVGSALFSGASGLIGHFMPLSKSEKQQNQFNAQQAQLNRDWQTQMSNTSYQRSVVDMEKAGLNPQMMYGGVSSGASTPSGSSASSGGFSNRGLQAMQTSLALQKSLADIRLTKAEARVREAEAERAPEQFDAYINNLIASTENANAKTALTMSQTLYQNAQNEFARDIFALNVQLSQEQVKLTKEQADNVHASTGFIALQQITEIAKWDLLDAQTKETLSRVNVNEANYAHLVADIQRIYSDIELNTEQTAFVRSQSLASDLRNDRSFKKPSSKVGKFAYGAYKTVYNLCEAFGQLLGGSVSYGYSVHK